MLPKPLDDFRNFIYTQYFSDGIKMTIGVLLPSLIFFQLNLIEIGITLSIGAVCASMADSPGPWIHRRNAMLITNLIVFVVALITAFINDYEALLGIEILLFCFIFSMFYVYGNRAASVGTAALFVMIINIDNLQADISNLEHAGLIFTGGMWYFLLSMLFSTLRPYRYAQQTLGECVQEIARYMRLRSKFYNDKVPVETIFKELVDKQVIVHQLQDNVREALFKTRKLVKESTTAGRFLVILFVDMVDMFEQTMATHHDYEIIRNRYKNYDILPNYALLIHKLSIEIEYLGFCILHQIKPRKHSINIQDLDDLKQKLDDLEQQGVSVLVLKKILVNLRQIFNKVNVIFGYFNQEDFIKQTKSGSTDHQKFITHQSFDFKLFRNNLNLNSSNFRYALRLAIVAFIGFLAGKLLPIGHHSYWIVLTILVILKPGFSMTKQRNYERAIGTVLGGILGALILFLIKDDTALFIIMVVFMTTMFSLQRVNYFISVLFMTPYILIMFSFISNTTGDNIVTERVLDTLIGSGIAFISSYLILPSWESYQFKKYMADMLKANLKYFETIYKSSKDEEVNVTEYKLARKEVYVSTANLAAAFQRMLNEPKNKQHKSSELAHKFVVLNHVLSSYLANLATALKENQSGYIVEQEKLFRRISLYLNEAIKYSEEKYKDDHDSNTSFSSEKYSDNLITEQMELISKVSADILKISQKL
jgi:uncharacterized membrane protein (TIGR01666 family)